VLKNISNGISTAKNKHLLKVQESLSQVYNNNKLLSDYGATTLCLMTCDITTWSIWRKNATLNKSILSYSVVMLSVTILIVFMLGVYAECLCWMALCLVALCWVALCSVSLSWASLWWVALYCVSHFLIMLGVVMLKVMAPLSQIDRLLSRDVLPFFWGDHKIGRYQ